MNLRQTIRLLGDCPADYLDTECPLSLGAFLVGYKGTDASVGLVMVELLRRIPGPSQADGCTRGYLEYGPGTNGFLRTFETVQAIVEELQPEPSAGMDAERAFIDIVRSPIESGRTGTVLGEPHIVWLADFYRGFLAGLESVAPHAARGASASLQRFELWLRDRYGQPRSRWHAIVRIFEGADMRGLQRFVALWDEFESSS